MAQAPTAGRRDRGRDSRPLPRPLIYQIQPLKRYTYIKFKHQVLIENPMTRKIVDIFPES
jgi:hypothetical protein